MHGPNKRNLVFEESVCGSRKNLVMEPQSFAVMPEFAGRKVQTAELWEFSVP